MSVFKVMAVMVVVTITLTGCNNKKRKTKKSAHVQSSSQHIPLSGFASPNMWTGVFVGGRVDVSKLCKLESHCLGSDVGSCVQYITHNPMTGTEQSLVQECLATADRDCRRLLSCLSVSETVEDAPKAERAIKRLIGGRTATKKQCQKAADNLTEKGGILGTVFAGELLKEGGEAYCEGNMPVRQVNCYAELEEVSVETLTACEN
jgi:uncharacterized lipoprotein NlpE involved in copper resistance